MANLVPLDLTVRLMSESDTVVNECSGHFQLETSADRRAGDTIEVELDVVCNASTYHTTFANVPAETGARVTVDLPIQPSRVVEIEGGRRAVSYDVGAPVVQVAAARIVRAENRTKSREPFGFARALTCRTTGGRSDGN
jgi:hypothetical protein